MDSSNALLLQCRHDEVRRARDVVSTFLERIYNAYIQLIPSYQRKPYHTTVHKLRRKCLWDSFASRSELLRTIDFIARLCGGEHAFLQSGEASRQSWTGSASAEDGVECFGVSDFVDLATGGRCDWGFVSEMYASSRGSCSLCCKSRTRFGGRYPKAC